MGHKKVQVSCHSFERGHVLKGTILNSLNKLWNQIQGTKWSLPVNFTLFTVFSLKKSKTKSFIRWPIAHLLVVLEDGLGQLTEVLDVNHLVGGVDRLQHVPDGLDPPPGELQDLGRSLAVSKEPGKRL